MVISILLINWPVVVQFRCYTNLGDLQPQVEMPVSLGFMVGSKSLIYLGAKSLSIRLSIAVGSVRSSCLLYLEVVSIVVLSYPILCPVVHD